jgi:hypothetical protein
MAKLKRVGEDTELVWHDDSEYLEWLAAPCAHGRDSGPLQESNHAAALEMFKEADPEANDHRVCRIGHWGCGWIEGIIVRPGTRCQEVAEEIADSLEGYPVLDEADFCQREHEEYLRGWDDFGATAFRKGLHKLLPKLTDDEQEWLDNLDHDQLRGLYEQRQTNGEFYICEDGGVYINVDRALKDIDYPDFASWMAGPEKPPRPDQPLLFEIA